MITALITGVGSNIGEGIIKALRLSKIKIRIIGTDIHPLSAGLFRCDKGYVVPPANSENFKEVILRICKNERVNIIFVGSDPEISFFSLEKNNIEQETGSFVLASPYKLVNTFHDKWLSFLFFKENGFNCPQSILKDEIKIKEFVTKTGFPLVVKPRIGRGSRDVFVVKDEAELRYALTKVSDPIIQEYISSDEEYTCGIFFDSKSKPKGIIIMKRELLAGTTYRAIVDDYPEIRKEIEKIAKKLSAEGAIGPLNVQCRLLPKGPVILEINPRFSGTTAIRAHFNFNEPALSIRHFIMGEELGELNYTKGIMMRYWEEVYISIEDGEKIIKEGVIENPISEIRRVF